MISENATREEVIDAVDNVANETLTELRAIGSDKLNLVPFANSWTPAQLSEHLIKSADAIALAMKKPFDKTQRDPKERLSELKAIFLDMSSKLTSPERLQPAPGPFEFEMQMLSFRASYDRMMIAADKSALDTLVTGFPLGPLTKWELLHFTVYHTTRHLHQLREIRKVLLRM